MAIDGSLADVGLADICQLLSLGRKTGCLTVTNRSNFGYVYFLEGRINYAWVLDRPHRFGELLVRNGVLAEEQLAGVLGEQAGEGPEALGKALLDQGLVDEADLETWIGVQTQEAVFHLFTWNEGSFHFDPDEEPDEAPELLTPMNVDSLLMEGARRVDEWTQIEKEIPSLDLIFEPAPGAATDAAAELGPDERAVLALVDGSRTVRDLTRDSGHVEFETGKALLGLLQAGLVKKAGRRSPEGTETAESVTERHLTLGRAFYRAGMLEDAAQEFEAVLRNDPGQVTARFRLGIIALKAGDPEKALAHFDAVSEDERRAYGVLRNRALALEQLGRFEDALDTLVEAGKTKPGDPDLTLAHAITELKSGKARAARTTFRRYRREIGQRSPSAMYYAYAVLAASVAGHHEEAIALGREGLKVHPADPALLVNTGAVLDHRGDHEAAEQYFTRALSAGTDPPAQAHKNLGDQAFRRGDIVGARAHYEDAVRLEPELGDDTFLKLGQISLEDTDRRMAALLLRRAIELNPENQEARACLEALSPPD